MIGDADWRWSKIHDCHLCGTDISLRHNNAQYCKPCAVKMREFIVKEKMARYSPLYTERRRERKKHAIAEINERHKQYEKLSIAPEQLRSVHDMQLYASGRVLLVSDGSGRADYR